MYGWLWLRTWFYFFAVFCLICYIPQLEPYKAVPLFTKAHPSKIGKARSAKTLINPVIPGAESERRTREDTQG